MSKAKILCGSLLFTHLPILIMAADSEVVTADLLRQKGDETCEPSWPGKLFYKVGTIKENVHVGAAAKLHICKIALSDSFAQMREVVIAERNRRGSLTEVYEGV